jgi:hypothetical protein
MEIKMSSLLTKLSTAVSAIALISVAMNSEASAIEANFDNHCS